MLTSVMVAKMVHRLVLRSGARKFVQANPTRASKIPHTSFCNLGPVESRGNVSSTPQYQAALPENKSTRSSKRPLAWVL